jgi:hypothetical protein
LTSGRKKNTQTAPIKQEGNQIKPYFGLLSMLAIDVLIHQAWVEQYAHPQFNASGLIKYGAVKVVSH